jgi:hypothetical protein
MNGIVYGVTLCDPLDSIYRIDEFRRTNFVGTNSRHFIGGVPKWGLMAESHNDFFVMIL